MFDLFIGGKKTRTATQVRRELNNAAGAYSKNPNQANRQKLEKLRKEWNSFSQKRKKK